jgi:hypothetical protein
MNLTNEQEAEFIEGNAEICPCCKHNDLEGGNVNIEQGIAYQKVYCNCCDFETQLCFTLTHIN